MKCDISGRAKLNEPFPCQLYQSRKGKPVGEKGCFFHLVLIGCMGDRMEHSQVTCYQLLPGCYLGCTGLWSDLMAFW